MKKDKKKVIQLNNHFMHGWEHLYPLLAGIIGCSLILFVCFLIVSPVRNCDCSNIISTKCINWCNNNSMEILAQPEIPSWIVLLVMFVIIIPVVWWVKRK